jgi:hypothetical protein
VTARYFAIQSFLKTLDVAQYLMWHCRDALPAGGLGRRRCSRDHLAAAPDIAFDSKTLRVIAEAEGTINAAVSELSGL